MHLVYLDESGNTGTDLNDSQQPVFLLGALIVPEDCWQSLEQDLENTLAKHFPQFAQDGLEVHAADLRAGRNDFHGHSVTARIALRDEWFAIAISHRLKFVYRAIEKRRFQKWSHATYGTGVVINPHVAAFPLVARVVDEYLSSVSDETRGMFISDVKSLRGFDGVLRLSRIVEKGFFIDSSKSRPLQLCDLCAYSARKMEEVKIGLPLKPIDQHGVALVQSLIHRGNESLQDVLAWLVKEVPGAKK